MNENHWDDDTLTLYAWNELPSDKSEAVARHLVECEVCRAKVEALLKARAGLQLLAEETVTNVPSVWPEVKRRSNRRPRLRWWAAAAAAVLFGVILLRQSLFRTTPVKPGETGFAVIQAEVNGRPAQVFVFTPNDSVTTVWLE